MAAEHGITSNNDYSFLPLLTYLSDDSLHQAEYVQAFVYTTWAQEWTGFLRSDN